MVGKAIAALSLGAVGAGVGSVAGSLLGANTPGSNNISGSSLGAVGGGIAGTVAGAMIVNPRLVGKAGLAAIGGVGAAAIGTAEVVGAGAIAAAPYVGKAAAVAGSAVGAVGISAATKYGSYGAGFAKSLVKPIAEGSTRAGLFGHQLSGFGISMIAGAGLVSGTKEAFDSFNRNRMGQMDRNIYRAAPQTPSYANNGGATGDLVFAMNANRKG